MLRRRSRGRCVRGPRARIRGSVRCHVLRPFVGCTRNGVCNLPDGIDERTDQTSASLMPLTVLLLGLPRSRGWLRVIARAPARAYGIGLRRGRRPIGMWALLV